MKKKEIKTYKLTHFLIKQYSLIGLGLDIAVVGNGEVELNI